MKTLTPEELVSLRSSGKPIVVFDIREAYECDIVSIEATHFPMGEIMGNIDKIPTDKPVVFFCKTGQRAEALVDLLTTQHGFTNLHNLEGGILGYVEAVDPSLPTY